MPKGGPKTEGQDDTSPGGVTDLSSIIGTLGLDNGEFSVENASGNTTVAGTLAVTGATGVDGNFDD